MPTIYDNINEHLIASLRDKLNRSDSADFCVGYFNLRGWKQLDEYVERWSGEEGSQCRLLIGMHRLPEDEARDALRIIDSDEGIDNKTAIQLKKKLAEEFRRQLMFGVPSNADEAGLRRLAKQIRERKVVVKLYLRHTLHAKLYLLFHEKEIVPRTAFLGSSNLTLAGLSHQGELNIDSTDKDVTAKLAEWFNARWEDRWCVDISEELAEIIETSWAREDLIPPYHIYVKMAYHLSKEARDGLSEFRIPKDLETKLFEFQRAAVKIAAHHLHKRNGVLIGDVVGLGKTFIATTLARVFEDDFGLETLIISPKNLTEMWEYYRMEYGLRGKVMSMSRVIEQLPKLPRFRLVVIDESHNLRNREGKRYRAIYDYINKNASKCILLTATPYNKTYLDLSNQLRLFVDEERDIGIRPEQRIREIGETEFIRKHQCPLRSLAAFEKSEHTEDWQELMRLYLVRRTRSFVKENYAKTDPESGRKYIPMDDGTKSYFPLRSPKTLTFPIDEKNPDDQYARLYSPEVVDSIGKLHLPRYGLGGYLAQKQKGDPPSAEERELLDNLGRAGNRLIGFCRTNLFKRLESSGMAFSLSVERHIIRNYVYLHAFENNLALPIGTQDAGLLDVALNDEDADSTKFALDFGDVDTDDEGSESAEDAVLGRSDAEYRKIAEDIYNLYQTKFKRRFSWLNPRFFQPRRLKKNLQADIDALCDVLERAGKWNPEKDTKLDRLEALLERQHGEEKILVFSQFADTVRYLKEELEKRRVMKLAAVTGDTDNPTAIAQRFSPESNKMLGKIDTDRELRVVIATDVLSEGQNLQDCGIIVNYDLPWAIIRLIQRAGRVDRIGQKAEKILCYSFLPAEGVERLLRLRSRLSERLTENAEVVGTDEYFFEDDDNGDDDFIRDLYNEKAGILDGDDDTDVDLASHAYQIWKNAIEREKGLEKKIRTMPDVVFSTKPHFPTEKEPEGALVYVRTGNDTDALAWINEKGESVTESQSAILNAAECEPQTPALERFETHHEMVRRGVKHVASEEYGVGGQLGRPSGARFKTYERLKNYMSLMEGDLFMSGDRRNQLQKSIDEIYRAPLLESAKDKLNRHLRSGIKNDQLADLVIRLRQDDMLTVPHEEAEGMEPRIICSMGLRKK